MKPHLLFAVALAFGLTLHGPVQAASPFPVDVSASRAPQPVMADGQVRLLYELRLTNFSGRTVELDELQVLGDDQPLASFKDAALEALLGSVGPEAPAGQIHEIPAGRTVYIFLDLALPKGVAAPATLSHRLSLSAPRPNAAPFTGDVPGPTLTVDRRPAPILRPPLRGRGWLAANALSNPDHRRSQNLVDGHAYIAQRFAIDWVRLGPDGRMLHGDPGANASFYDYGVDVLAVADGVVASGHDGQAENAGANTNRAVPVTLETIAGDNVILDLGSGRFALYGHLQPGSLKVKPGDHVHVGQVLARLGNSGNSDAPHLHFQLMDANSPLGAEGLPYELDNFEQVGMVTDSGVIDAGKAWTPPPGAPAIPRHDEFPLDNAVTDFPDR